MKVKKILAVISVCALTMTSIVGCGFEPPQNETESEATSDVGIDVSTIIMEDKYLDWTEADYNKASLEERMNVYATYLYKVGAETGLSAGYTEEKFIEEIAATYTAEDGDAVMKEVYAAVEKGTLGEAIEQLMMEFESAMEQELKAAE
jgi:hypothetical protein